MKLSLLTQYAAEAGSIKKLIKDTKGNVSSQRPAMVAEAANRAKQLAEDLEAML